MARRATMLLGEARARAKTVWPEGVQLPPWVTTAAAALTRFSRRAIAPVIVAAALYMLWGYSYGEQYKVAGDPGAFIHPGATFGAPFRILPHGVVVYPGTGFDGQTAFYLGLDPFLGKGYDRYLDQPAYRYQRILLPALGWLTSFGSPEALKWSLPAINLIAILLSGFLLARFLAVRGRSVWWALAYMLNFGLAISFLNDVSDPLATALLLAGVIFWLERRARLAIVFLTLTVLARETALPAVAVIALLELYRERRRALAWLTPVGAGLIWEVYVAIHFSTDQFQNAAQPRRIPLTGAVDKLDSVISTDIVGSANWETMAVLLLILTSVFVIVYAAREATHLKAERERLAIVPALPYAVLVIFLSLGLWSDPLSYPRYAAPLAGFLLLDWALRRRRASAFLATALVSLTFLNPLFGLLPDKFGPILTAPGAAPRSQSDQLSTPVIRAP